MFGKDKLLGVLGGMGPQASCELYRLVNLISLQDYKVVANADFVHLLIDSVPVPDLIVDEKSREDTVRFVADEARRLCQAGVTDLFMACNTMHAFWPQITSGLTCSAHSLIDIVVQRVMKDKAHKVFILGTNTTISSGLYQEAFQKNQISYVVPEAALQAATVQSIVKFIAGVLTPKEKEDFISLIVEALKQTPDVDTILLACTELPIFLPSKIGDLSPISSLEELARYMCFQYYGAS